LQYWNRSRQERLVALIMAGHVALGGTGPHGTGPHGTGQNRATWHWAEPRGADVSENSTTMSSAANKVSAHCICGTALFLLDFLPSRAGKRNSASSRSQHTAGRIQRIGSPRA
jgi:hypothetical protein